MQYADSLLLKASNGDDNAFNKLVGLWFKRIYNFSYKYFGDYDTAMEVTQSTFITVHKNLHQLRELTSFKPWLYRIALNHCHDEGRKIKQRNVVSLYNNKFGLHEEVACRVAGEVDYSPDQKLQRQELAGQILDCLQKLNKDQRVIVIMKEYEGLKFREIAEALDISENTAKSRLYYGLKSLKKWLTEANINLETYSHD
jgi:RNA polymerase sigma-70 factor (ECF subfamily)